MTPASRLDRAGQDGGVRGLRQECRGAGSQCPRPRFMVSKGSEDDDGESWPMRVVIVDDGYEGPLAHHADYRNEREGSRLAICWYRQTHSGGGFPL